MPESDGSSSSTSSTMLTAAALQWVLTFVLAGPACVLATVLLLRSSWWWLAVAYLAWYYFDRDTPKRGGRRVQAVRSWSLWRLMARYFPARLHCTQQLSTDCNYILGFHPHGVLSAGAFLSFASEATGFSQIFPGITPYLAVLEGQFDFPLYRDYLMMSGTISVRRDSLQHVLRKRKSGQLVCLLPGGAHEALDSHPGSEYRIHLRNKLGFVRLAIETGSHLLPCFSFGEIDLFDQAANPRGSLLRRTQSFLIKIFGFSMPVFQGRKLLIPFAKPINTVVGQPVQVERNADPSAEEVQQVLDRYISEVESLFNSQKAKFVGSDAKLIIE